MRWLIAIVAIMTSHGVCAGRLSAPIEVRLSCPAQGVFLDGTAILGETAEQLLIQSLPVAVTAKDKSEKSQQGWFSDVKISSNKRTYVANLLANGKEYAVIAYGELVREGITSSLMSVVYQINFATLAFKRTVTFYPGRRDSSFEGVCKKV
jgi:hypothetical protein